MPVVMLGSPLTIGIRENTREFGLQSFQKLLHRMNFKPKHITAPSEYQAIPTTSSAPSFSKHSKLRFTYAARGNSL